ncbi:DJ-1/PfpI family protein [Maribacter sp. 4G9]|uniref:DJ-1/PfpI family protein n=1 Tax=Maribacter sp. 4G9 TaxID=1889777 RepID=UPI000C15E6B1|nr:DJ-1/PfpI family protein [Maribacter sp. 4G9]PIB39190.1 dimethyladenosine transferase [Maribacter sp. 4G9]
MTTDSKTEKKEIAFILFDDYETLDVFGPAEIFGRLVDKYSLKFYSLEGGVISNRHKVPIMTEKLSTANDAPYMILVPGGLGTRKEVTNELLIDQITALSNASDYVLTVCTGSALLAKTGLLDNKEATSNKRAFSWVVTTGPKVIWDRTARWKIDGKYYTSSGVSAGMDMSLGFLADRHGIDFARNVALEIEYNWIEDKDNDTFKAK